MLTERVEQIKIYAREKGEHSPEDTFEYDKHKLALEKYHTLELWEKIARSTADAVRMQKIYIEPFDHIIGRTYHLNSRTPEQMDPELDDLTDAMTRVRAEIEDYAEFADFTEYSQLPSWTGKGHIAWDWNRILRYGTEGMKKMCHTGLSRKKDEKSQQFYKGVLIMLEAMEDWNDAHVKKLEELGMTEMAEICRRVPRYPARTFHEAVQSYFMQHIVVMKENPFGGNSPGRLDYYLWPYLENDLKEGKCTLEEARELIDELFLRIDERIHLEDGWGETIVVGGCHANGTSAVNPLSYIMVESFIDLNITHPYFYIRLPENPPKDFVKLAARYMKEGSNRCQILSDTNIMHALTEHGVTYQDAVDYYCGGCMEIGIQGKTADYLYNGWHNIVKIVELAVTGGYCLKTGKQLKSFRIRRLEEYASFEEFYADFIKETQRILHMFFKVQDICSEYAEKYRPSYLISSMIEDCMQKGRNMHGGGARYYDYGSAPLGMPNAADYLYAVKKAIFDDRICTPAELLDALWADYEGYEVLRAKLSAIPKYGQGNPEADEMARRLFSDISDAYTSYVNRFGGRGKVVVLTFVYAPIAGGIMGATADGNHAGKYIAHGVTPQSSSMTEGITTAINSCTSIPSDIYNGGASTMWDFDASWVTEELLESLFTTFIAQGGQIFQGNTTDVETLLKAQEHPEEYPDLLVRVGGFSGRFVNLLPEVQKDIINRIRHNH